MERRVLSSLLTIKSLFPLIIIFLFVQKYIFINFEIIVLKCKNDNISNDEINNRVTINLKRIKEFYLDKNSFHEDIFIPSSLKQTDWHNYTQIELDKLRDGIGEQGRPASLSKQEKNVLSKYGYNSALSERIPLNRSLPDVRHPDCIKRLYLKTLPTVSIVIPFHNEHLGTLLRTVFSVLNRAPSQLVKEVFLVNDTNAEGVGKEAFDNYVRDMPKVKILHMLNRSGLVGARLAGAKAASGEVLIFLDSHVEANVNWLPPLLEPIALDYRTVVVPTTDMISFNTFEYIVIDNGARGSFNWGLTYSRIPLTPKDKSNLPEPFETPIMEGGLFAIARRFFWELGGYDPDLRIWGAEQYELSFKIWQCGGRMLEAPCSRFGHVYRSFDPSDHTDHISWNFRRVVDVWMDEYAQYVYAKRPEDLFVNPGNLTEQKALRKRLNCKPFRWFITQIAFDITQQYPIQEPLPYAEGRIRPIVSPHLCIDGNHGVRHDPFILKKCNPKNLHLPQEKDDQKFVMTWFNDVMLKSRRMCWDYKNGMPGSHLILYNCHGNGGNQMWRYYEEMKRFVCIGSTECLDHNPRNGDLFLNICDDNSKTQLWLIDTIYKERMDKWNMSNVLKVTGPAEEWKE